jgi:hypothetical protein
VLRRISGVMRIRHRAFLANRCRRAKLAQIREAIGQAAKGDNAAEATAGNTPDWSRCRHCGEGRLRIVAILQAARWPNRYRPPPGVTSRRH